MDVITSKAECGGCAPSREARRGFTLRGFGGRLLLLGFLGMSVPVSAAPGSVAPGSRAPTWSAGELTQPRSSLSMGRPSRAALLELSQEAEQLYRQGKDAEAMQIFSSLIELAPQHRLDAWLRIGNIHQRNGSLGAALDAYRNLRPEQPTNAAKDDRRSPMSASEERAHRQDSGRNSTESAAKSLYGHAGAKAAPANRGAPALSVAERAVQLKGMVNLSVLALEQGREALGQIEMLQRDPAVRAAAGMTDDKAAELVQALLTQAAQIQQMLGVESVLPSPSRMAAGDAGLRRTKTVAFHELAADGHAPGTRPVLTSAAAASVRSSGTGSGHVAAKPQASGNGSRSVPERLEASGVGSRGLKPKPEILVGRPAEPVQRGTEPKAESGSIPQAASAHAAATQASGSRLAKPDMRQEPVLGDKAEGEGKASVEAKSVNQSGAAKTANTSDVQREARAANTARASMQVARPVAPDQGARKQSAAMPLPQIEYQIKPEKRRDTGA